MLMKLGYFSLALAGAALADDVAADSTSNCPSEKFCCGDGQFCQAGIDRLKRKGKTVQTPNPRNGVPQTVVKIEDTNILSLLDDDDDDEPAPRFGLQFKINLVSNYGCWCYAWSQWQTGDGRSSPRDEHDDACKAHSMGFKCITMDAKAEGKECHPYETSYSTLITQNGYGQDIVECADSIEDDWCKRRVCLVELRLLARFYNLIGSGTWPDYAQFGHRSAKKGLFDPVAECNPLAGANPVEQVCCGDYPYRTWFYANQANSQDTQCCEYEDPAITKAYGFSINVGRLYNSQEKQCTANGVENL